MVGGGGSFIVPWDWKCFQALSSFPQANGGLVFHFVVCPGLGGMDQSPRSGMGSRIGVQGPGGERGLGVGENTAPCQIWAQAWLQTLAGRGRQGQREKLLGALL